MGYFMINRHTPIRNPSTTSAMSLAPFTRDRAFTEDIFCSSSDIADIQVSPTGVSRIALTNEGEMLRSLTSCESGFSIFCNQKSGNIVLGKRHIKKGGAGLTFLPCSLASNSLLLPCKSDIWPETAAKSLWNFARKDSRESKRSTLA